MFTFRDKLYVSDNINVSRAKWKIKTGRGQFDIYLIVFNHDNNKLEYFHNGILKQKILLKKDWDVVGLAKGEDECQKLVTQIINETYESTGGYNIADYLG